MSIPLPDPGGQRIAANWRKRPARDRRSCLSAGRLILPSLSDIAGRAHNSSDCAALLAAFGQMDLALGSHVLVPSDHCPKIIGPVMQAGLVPVIYSIGPDGLPKLQNIAPTDLTNTGAIIAAQRLGLPRSLQTAQEQSRVRHIQVIEDCAHGYFGWAGNRPVGHWSDFAIGSLTKHFPVGKAGLQAPAHHPLSPLGLSAPRSLQQIKSMVNVVKLAHLPGRLWGIGHLAPPLLRLKLRRRSKPSPGNNEPQHTPKAYDIDAMPRQCGIGRVRQRPSATTVALRDVLSRQRRLRQWQANHYGLVNGLAGARRAKPLLGHGPRDIAPYAMPLRVEDANHADRMYAATRAAELPVFRWDLPSPGAIGQSDDCGATWGHQVTQVRRRHSLGDIDIKCIR